jgi:uncharacterized protein (DUF983 family)
MFEGIANLDFSKWIDYLLHAIYRVFRIPFEWWNAVPMWIHLALLIIILTIAGLLAYATIKYRNEWKYRY